MVKKIICSLCLSFVCLFSNPLQDAIKNLLGYEAYQINQNFIHRLFNKQESFYQENGTLDYYAITKVLKENGLLILNLNKPTDFALSIKAKTNPIFLIRTINSVLSSIGYSYFTISKAKHSQGEVELVFSLATERIVDPVIVLDELKKRGFVTNRIAREQSDYWLYEVQLVEPIISNAVAIERGNQIELKNVSGEYWLKVSQVGTINVVKKNSKIEWNPRIVLYDKNLQILEMIAQNDFIMDIDIEILEQTVFVMITDLNNPSRLKGGLIVTFD